MWNTTWCKSLTSNGSTIKRVLLQRGDSTRWVDGPGRRDEDRRRLRGLETGEGVRAPSGRGLGGGCSVRAAPASRRFLGQTWCGRVHSQGATRTSGHAAAVPPPQVRGWHAATRGPGRYLALRPPCLAAKQSGKSLHLNTSFLLSLTHSTEYSHVINFKTFGEIHVLYVWCNASCAISLCRWTVTRGRFQRSGTLSFILFRSS